MDDLRRDRCGTWRGLHWRWGGLGRPLAHTDEVEARRLQSQYRRQCGRTLDLAFFSAVLLVFPRRMTGVGSHGQGQGQVVRFKAFAKDWTRVSELHRRPE